MEYSGYEPGTVPDAPYIARFVPQGYAFIGVSLRGTGCSGGVWDFFQPVEATDGYDVIEWIARQQWSNARVAMIGKSYPGITQRLLTDPIAGLENYEEMMRRLEEKEALKVFVNVAR